MKVLAVILAAVVTALVAALWDRMADRRTTFYFDEYHKLHFVRKKGRRVRK